MPTDSFILWYAVFLPLVFLVFFGVSRVVKSVSWQRSFRIRHDLKGLLEGETLIGVIDRKHRPYFCIGREVRGKKTYE
jgi:hypothetical protein